MATISATLVGLVFIAIMLHIQNIKEIVKELKEQIPRANFPFTYYIICSHLFELIILSIPLYIFLNFYLFEDSYYVRLVLNSLIVGPTLFAIYTINPYFLGSPQKYLRLLFRKKIIKIIFRLKLFIPKAGFLRLLFIPSVLIFITWSFVFYSSKEHLGDENLAILSSASIIFGLLSVFLDIFLSQPESLLFLADRAFINYFKPISDIIKAVDGMRHALLTNTHHKELREEIGVIHMRMLKFYKTYFMAYVKLKQLPEELLMNGDFEEKIFYDQKRNTLFFCGVMTEEERDKLLTLNMDPFYKKGIEKLFKRSQDINIVVASDILLQLQTYNSLRVLSNQNRQLFVSHNMKFE